MFSGLPKLSQPLIRRRANNGVKAFWVCVKRWRRPKTLIHIRRQSECRADSTSIAPSSAVRCRKSDWF